MSTTTVPGDIRLLLVGDACAVLRRAAGMARDAGAEVSIAPTPADALTILRGESVALVMIDVMTDVPAFMAQLRRERFAVPVMACGIDAPAGRAVAAIRAGARDYVPLPPEPALIAAALAAVAAPPTVDPIGTDPAFVAARDYARGLAQGRVAILLSGEPGTGKALLARTVHAASRRSGRMLTVECAGVSRDVVEAELLGHAPHEASGIAGSRTGKIAQAAGGTLFVRDIDRLAPETQARLVASLAADAGIGDVRLVAASSLDLAKCVRDGTFRADLLARIAGARIALPPLRARGGDLAALAVHFGTRAARAEGLPDRPLCPDAVRSLAGYDWPGNLRELEDVIARAVVIAAGATIGARDLVLVDGIPLAARAHPADARVDALVGRTVEEVERALILRTLETCGGNRTSASGILGISVRTMRNKLRTFVEAGIAVAPAV